MVTKIKPRRVKTDTTGTSGDSLAYQDEASFQWGGAGTGDMRYADFNFATESGGSVVLGLRTEISPSENFTVAPPTAVKDGQIYILRVTNGATAYTMALTGGITNPHGASLTLTPNSTDQFVFLAVGTTLELQPEDTGGAVWGLITGTLSDQTDLQTALNLKADDNAVVHNTGNETIAGTKTFSTSPVVPSKTTDATNTGTAIATEAQVYKKQDKLTQGTGISISSNTVSNTGVLSVNSNVGAINLKTINSTSLIGTGDIVTPTTTVEDNLTSTSTTNALSANQGRILDGKIADLMALGKFLSLWNAATGQPVSFPYTTPYAYSTGDYFLVSTVSSSTPPVNYRPTGNSYTGTASSTAETDELEVGDVYIYDGSLWLLQSNHGKTVTFANIAGQPTDNTNLATALAQKQDVLTAGDNITIDGNNNISADVNTKTFYLSGTSDLTTAQAIYDYYVAGNNPIMKQGTISYTCGGVSPTEMTMTATETLEDHSSNSYTSLYIHTFVFALNSGTVTGITTADGDLGTYLSIGAGYSIPYTPTSNGDPATKKYVDDSIAAIPTYDPEKPDYTKMQGPAPAGYHVPSKDEWVALCDILTTTFSLAGNDTTMATYLKMPMTYVRSYSTGSLGLTTLGSYWASTAYSTDFAYRLYFDIGTLNPQNGFYRSYGFSVRCFKNSPIIPTASWTTLFDGSGIAAGAGIFHSTTDGLISISADGQNRTTIEDKNLGATSTDTTSADSYGYTYQRGNNYGFPMGGTITTSGTKVDASGYGPGNRYSSSTFITTSTSPYDWSSVQNDDLRGGISGLVKNYIQNDTTGTTTTVTKIRAGTEAEYALITPVATTVYIVM